MFNGSTSYFVAPLSFLQMNDAYIQIPIQGLGQSNIYLSDNGDVNALKNSCAHRGMQLLQDPIGRSKLSCRYHGWRYCNAGYLKPNRVMGRKNNVRLDHRTLSVQNGFVSNGAIKSSELLAVLQNVNGSVEHQPMHFECLPHQANWKWLIENVLEAYHLDFVHRKSFVEQGFQMTSEVSNLQIGNSSTMYLPKKRFGRGFYKHGYVFPNLFISNTSDFITFCSIVIPIDENNTNLFWFLYPGEKLHRLPEDMQHELIQQSVDFTRQVLAEDKEMVEAQHIGCGSHREYSNITDVEPRLKWFYDSINAMGLI